MTPAEELVAYRKGEINELSCEALALENRQYTELQIAMQRATSADEKRRLAAEIEDHWENYPW